MIHICIFCYCIYISYLEIVFMENMFDYDKCFYDDLRLLKFTPSFYYYLALTYDVDILRYVPHPSKEYDFKTIVNNMNESIYHVAIALSIYIYSFLF